MKSVKINATNKDYRTTDHINLVEIGKSGKQISYTQYKKRQTYTKPTNTYADTHTQTLCPLVKPLIHSIMDMADVLVNMG